MSLYSKSAYGSQFSGEKKRFENLTLGCRDIKQTWSLIFFGTPCMGLLKRNFDKTNGSPQTQSDPQYSQTSKKKC